MGIEGARSCTELAEKAGGGVGVGVVDGARVVEVVLATLGVIRLRSRRSGPRVLGPVMVRYICIF
jgi:hypothetical protein